MTPELENLITLQEIESRAADAHKRITEAPDRIAALDAKLNAARQAVDAAKQAVAGNQAHRRTIDKDLQAAQQQLSKSKETLMAVKTNHEYHAMQSQIAAGTAEVARIEEQMLVNMMEADEVGARLKQAEAALKGEEVAIARERKAIEEDARQMQQVVADSDRERQVVRARILRESLETFDRVLKGRQGLAVAQAIDGHCSICKIGLRPQVYNLIRRNEQILQCDHCQRILYFVPNPQPAVTENQ